MRQVLESKISWFDEKLSIKFFWIGLSVITKEFPSEILKGFFHLWDLSSWLAAYSFVLEVLFLPMTFFSVSHAICACLSFTELPI